MLSERLFAEMRVLLSESMSRPAVDTLLWHMGNKYGFALGRRTKKMAKTSGEAVELLAKAAQRSGWGKITVSDNFETTGKMVVVFENCVFCEGLENEKTPACSFLSGILAGIAESLYDRDVSIQEELCRAAGGGVCRFSINRV
ncbi:MAG: 4-vinyl reductase [Candidatus Caldarchaeum sp.]|uniref:4-vinyl reductase 4VR domain-containing protein n=2 Tax=Caldiarchaeum subterraneum TaxID=311458 RepID=A0A7J3G693_CALS0